MREGNFAGYGVMSDAVYGGTLGAMQHELKLTTTWAVNAAFEHHWNDQWKTSLYGGYQETTYDTRPTRSCACCKVRWHRRGRHHASPQLAATTTGAAT